MLPLPGPHPTLDSHTCRAPQSFLLRGEGTHLPPGTPRGLLLIPSPHIAIFQFPLPASPIQTLRNTPGPRLRDFLSPLRPVPRSTRSRPRQLPSSPDAPSLPPEAHQVPPPTLTWSGTGVGARRHLSGFCSLPTTRPPPNSSYHPLLSALGLPSGPEVPVQGTRLPVRSLPLQLPAGSGPLRPSSRPAPAGPSRPGAPRPASSRRVPSGPPSDGPSLRLRAGRGPLPPPRPSRRPLLQDGGGGGGG